MNTGISDRLIRKIFKLGRRSCNWIISWLIFAVVLSVPCWFPGAVYASDQDDVDAAKAALSNADFAFSGDDDASGITQDFYLPMQGLNGTDIEWAAEYNDYIFVVDWETTTINGKSYRLASIMGRPAKEQGDRPVNLTATITKGSEATATKTIAVTVEAEKPSDDELVQTDKDALTADSFAYSGEDYKYGITAAFSMPSSGANGTAIAYAVKHDPTSSVSLSGSSVTVERPTALEGDGIVTLTATVSKGTASATKDISAVVKAVADDHTPVMGSTVRFAGADWICLGRSNEAGYKLLRLKCTSDYFAYKKYKALQSITKHGTALVKGTDYVIGGTGGTDYFVTIKKEYLAAQAGDSVNLTFNYNIGDPEILSISLMDSASPNSVLNRSSATFIKKADYQKDIETTLLRYAGNLSYIKNGETVLTSGTHYSVSSNVVTIKKAYLAGLEGTTAQLTFNFSAGEPQTFTITLSAQPLPTGSINPHNAVFIRDKQADITVKVLEDYAYIEHINDYATSSLRAYLNEQFYHTFTDTQKELIKESVWNCGYNNASVGAWVYGHDADEAARTVTDYIGGITKSELEFLSETSWYRNSLDKEMWWRTITPCSNGNFYAMVWVACEAGLKTVEPQLSLIHDEAGVRPALYLKPDLVFNLVNSKYVLSPFFSPSAGNICVGGTVSISYPGADQIYYTTDGSIPELSAGSSTFEYTGPIPVNDALTLKAVAVKSGANCSEMGNASYTPVVPDEAALGSLALSSGSLSPEFARGTISYTASVANNVNSLSVTASVYDSNATLKINGTPSASGQASAPLSLNTGSNIISVEVSTQDGITRVIYTINVTRAENNTPSYTVSFDSNGGSTVNPQTVIAGQKAAKPSVPLKPGHIFAGWYSDSSLNPIFDFDTAITGDLTLYAAYIPDNSAIVLTAKAGDRSVMLNWSSQLDAVSFCVYQSKSSDNFNNALAAVAGSVYSYTVGELNNGTTYYFMVKAVDTEDNEKTSNVVSATPYRKHQDDSSEPASLAAAPPEPKNIYIQVNGRNEDAATATTRVENNRIVTSVFVDEGKVSQKLASEGNKAVVSISVNENSHVLISSLNGQTVKNMEDKEAILEIKTRDVTYTLPAAQINIEAINKQIGTAVKLRDINVNISISTPPADTVKVMADIANKNNFQLLVQPVEFSISCTSGSKTVEVSKFKGYVERTIALPEGVDPSKITTAIVLNDDGAFYHVPTAISVIDGKYYAKINSLTNSSYSIIYNPQSFADMEGHWAKNYVNEMGARLVVSGLDDGCYAPDRDVSRAEFTAIMARALGIRAESGSNRFSDAPDQAWFSKSLAAALDYQLISGYEDNSFRPGSPISRQEAMIIASRAMQIAGMGVEISAADTEKILAAFKDRAETGSWARPGVANCIKTGIVVGHNEKLNLSGNISRAETATLIMKILQAGKLI